MKILSFKEVQEASNVGLSSVTSFAMSYGEGEDYWEEWFEFIKDHHLSKIEQLEAEARSQAKYLSVIYERNITVDDLQYVM